MKIHKSLYKYRFDLIYILFVFASLALLPPTPLEPVSVPNFRDPNFVDVGIKIIVVVAVFWLLLWKMDRLENARRCATNS